MTAHVCRCLPTASQGRHGGMADYEEEKLSYAPDELLSMLTPDDLRAVHGHFNAAGGKMDMTSFVEVVQSHLDASKWKSSAAQVSFRGFKGFRA
jgi:hypothetical protein